MLTEHVTIRTFVIFLVLALFLGLGLAKLIYPSVKPPVSSNAPVQSQTDAVHFVFPEQEFTHPFKQTPPPPKTPGSTPNPELCAQVITSAVNKQTLEIRQFPTPCAVPAGWDILR